MIDELSPIDRQMDIEELMDANIKAELIDLGKAEGATFSKRGSKTQIATEILESRTAKAVEDRKRGLEDGFKEGCNESYKKGVKAGREQADEDFTNHQATPDPSFDPLAGKSLDERRFELEVAAAADRAAWDLAESNRLDDVSIPDETFGETSGDVSIPVRLPNGVTPDAPIKVFDGDANHVTVDEPADEIARPEPVDPPFFFTLSAAPAVLEATQAVASAVAAYNLISNGGHSFAPELRAKKAAAKARLAALVNDVLATLGK